LCVSAPTGSGKSLAYLLPIVHGLAGRKQSVLRALIVLPTRDLALQVASVASQFKSVNVHCFVGQHSMAEERAALQNGSTDIAVATMGRLVDHLVIGTLDLSFLRWLVVDEADRMLSKADLDKWSMVLSSVPETTQRLLFSATMTANPLKLNKLRLTRPVFVSVGGTETQSTGLPDTITHKYVVVPNKSMKVRGALKVLETVFGGAGELLAQGRLSLAEGRCGEVKE
jgi:superfamily II DNA/RNA helicase